MTRPELMGIALMTVTALLFAAFCYWPAATVIRFVISFLVTSAVTWRLLSIFFPHGRWRWSRIDD